MTERHIVLEDIDPVVFYGVNNVNMQMIKALYPKLRIVARGNIIKVMGDEEEMCRLEENIEKMRLHVLKFNTVKEEDIHGSYLDEARSLFPDTVAVDDGDIFDVPLQKL